VHVHRPRRPQRIQQVSQYRILTGTSPPLCTGVKWACNDTTGLATPTAATAIMAAESGDEMDYSWLVDSGDEGWR